MGRAKRKWRTPKQWYDEEYAPKTWGQYDYRVGLNQAFALFCVLSPFAFSYEAEGRLAWPTWGHVVGSLPLMVVGIGMFAWYASPAYKRRRAAWGHDSKIESLRPEEGMGYRAICDCGWEGPVRPTRQGAIEDHGEHLLPDLDPRRSRWRRPRL